ncbi:MAG: SDR family oxidoreductase [Gemmatimonas sp.]|uniref:SDR family NAD(P)-dependent oxidoreductase n=1 Tax=Gemmatimonas sp. TaxID=1962908 RepID=UPI0025C2F2F7|nr:SDR family oxidoreductase [Gemmatimonas sp.]MCE2955426.1 SDR family oxidoreductase [Gemmatimonas sp.]
MTDAHESSVVLITGAATGIGAACARAFARAGWRVAIATLPATQREAEVVQAECIALGADALVVDLDVTDDASCRRAADRTEQHFGRLDGLVNCAGVTRFVPHHDLEALPSSEFGRTNEVNVLGTFQMIRACRGALERSGRGAIVNYSSIAGLSGVGSSVAYAASKGAVIALTLSTARSLAPHIRVNAIAPGYVAGGLPSRVLDPEALAAVEARYLETQPLKRLLHPDEVAALTLFLVDGPVGITGEVIRIDNGLHLNG